MPPERRGRLRLSMPLSGAGYSAGACLLGPAFPGIDGTLVSGLDVVPFTIAPHVRHGANGLTAWFSDHDVPFIALRDGEAIVIDADTQRLVGQQSSGRPG
jgi:dipeptidase E